MADSKFGKYIITKPIPSHPDYFMAKDVKGVTFPNEIFMGTGFVKGSPALIDIGWHFTVPDPDPVEQIHFHTFDTILCLVGTDPQNPGNLGAELEIKLAEEKHILTRTCSIFIPKGLEHCLLAHRKVDRAYLKIEFGITDKNRYFRSNLA